MTFKSRSTPTNVSIRIIGILTIAGGAVLCAAQVYALAHTTPDRMIDYAVRAGADLVLGVGLGTAIVCLAGMSTKKVDTADPSLAAIQHVQSQVDQLSLKIGTLATKLESNRRESAEPILPFDPQAIGRMEHLLHEVRELSLLGDNDRRMRLTHHLEQRKRHMSRQIMDFVGHSEFARAEELLGELESQFPNDPHSVGCRRDLDTARLSNETRCVRDQTQKVENLMQMGLWDQALVTANDLADNFPRNPAAAELLERAARERDAFISTNAQAQYDEVRRHIEQRSWRLALTGAQTLLSRYPAHQRAQQMRQQLRTIQENADIEERQEAEVRIQEMIRAGQFRDAIDLAEDIIRRFPGSPQADAIEAMLPRLQDLAGEPQTPIA